jgi:hypothetical protein
MSMSSCSILPTAKHAIWPQRTRKYGPGSNKTIAIHTYTFESVVACSSSVKPGTLLILTPYFPAIKPPEAPRKAAGHRLHRGAALRALTGAAKHIAGDVLHADDELIMCSAATVGTHPLNVEPSRVLSPHRGAVIVRQHL